VTAKEKRVCLKLYNSYLKHSAILQHRGYRMVKDFEKVTKNTKQFKLFYALTYKCMGTGITTDALIEDFMNKARMYSRDDFYPITFVGDFEEIIKMEYSMEVTIEQIYDKVKKSIDYMKKIKNEEEINISEMIKGGKPPLIMKFWKKGDVDIHTMLTLIDYREIKSTSWYKIFCGNRQPEINQAVATINQDGRIKEIVKKLLKSS
jgi:hypothetical protein